MNITKKGVSDDLDFKNFVSNWKKTVDLKSVDLTEKENRLHECFLIINWVLKQHLDTSFTDTVETTTNYF